MNKGLHRIVFGQGLGQLVVVAETVKARGKGRSKASGRDGVATTRASGCQRLRAVAAAVCALLPWARPAWSQQVVDPNAAAGERATVLQSGAGVPVINITAPNGRGLSVNKFTQFDTAAPGVVFNNSAAGGHSLIGGYVPGNQNLGAGPQARAILTEVTGPQASTLAGAMESRGGKADLIFANPNGVTLNGVSTVNLNSLTATTGRPTVGADGALSLDVSQGHVAVGAGGVNTSGLSYFDIVSRSAGIQGVVTADSGATEVRVITGLNHYDAGGRDYRPNADSAPGTPQFAIDGSAAGSMYGNLVSLIATESGAGVRHAGSVLAEQDVVIRANGDLVVGPVQSRGAGVSLSGRSVMTNGEISAAQEVSLAGSGQVQTAAAVRAGGAVRIAGMQIGIGGDVAAASDIALQAQQGLVLSQGRIVGGTLHLRADSLAQKAGVTLSGKATRAQVLGDPVIQIVVNGAYTLTGRLMVVDASGQPVGGARIGVMDGQLAAVDSAGQLLQNRYVASDTLVRSAGELSLQAGSVHNAGAALLGDAGARIVVQATLDNAGLLKVAGGQLQVAAGAVRNGAQGEISASGAGVALAVGAGLDNAGAISADQVMVQGEGASAMLNRGDLLSRQGLQVDVGGLENAAGARLGAAGRTALTVRGTLANAGQIYGGQGVSVEAGQMTQVGAGGADASAGSLVASQGDVDVALHGDYVGSKGARVEASAGNAAIQGTGSLHNLSGSLVSAAHGLAVEVDGEVNNDGGSALSGAATAVVAGGAVNNRAGATMLGFDRLDVEGASITNQGATSTLYGGHGLSLEAAGDVQNAGGALLLSDGTLQLRGHVIRNVGQDSRLQGAGGVLLYAQQNVDNADGAVIRAGDALSIDAIGALINRGAGSALQGQSVQLSAGGALTNADGGQIQGTKGVSASAAGIYIQDGSIVAGSSTEAGDLALTSTKGIDNSGGTLAATGDLSLRAAGDIDNQAGGAILATNVSVQAQGALRNDSARLQAAQTLSASASTIDNQGDATTLMGAADVALTAQGSLRNAAWARIEGEQMVTLAGQDLRNAGKVTAGRLLTIDTDTYGNTGALHSDGDATLTMAHDQSLTLSATSFAPEANGLLTLNTKDLMVDVETFAAGSVQVNASGSVTNRQALGAHQDFVIDAQGAVTNANGGLLWAGRDLQIRTARIDNLSGGEISAAGNVVLLADTVNNAGHALIAAGKTLAIDAAVLNNESEQSGGITVTGGQSGSGQYDHYHDARHDHYELSLNGIPVLGSDLTVTPGRIESGGDMLLNQGAWKGRHAQVNNHNGQIRAGGSLYVNGDVNNLAAAGQEGLGSYLDRPVSVSLNVRPWTNIGTSLGGAGYWSYGSLREMLEAWLGNGSDDFHQISGDVVGYGWWDSKAIDTLKGIGSSSQLNQTLNLVLGADWKAQGFATLVTRWGGFKAGGASQAQTFYAQLPTEFSAAGNVVHTGGVLVNGGNQGPQQKNLTVTIGEHQTQTTLGQFDTMTNPGSLTPVLDPLASLSALLGNGHTYHLNPDASGLQPPPIQPAAAADATDGLVAVKAAAALAPAQGAVRVASLSRPPVPVVPLYLSSQPHDEADYFGSQYFFGLTGYDPGRTVAVLADNYTTDKIVSNLVHSQIGDFLASRDDAIQGNLVKGLMDNGAQEQQRLGLRVGLAPSEAQLAQQTKDFVWYVMDTVNGQQVMVPKVYLAKSTVAAYQGETLKPTVVQEPGRTRVFDTDGTEVVLSAKEQAQVRQKVADGYTLQRVAEGGLQFTAPPTLAALEMETVLLPAAAGTKPAKVVASTPPRGAASIHAGRAVSVDADQIANVDSQIRGRSGVQLQSKGDILNAATAGAGAGIEGLGGAVLVKAGGNISNQGAQITGADVSMNAGGYVESVAGMGFDQDGQQTLRNGALIAATARDGAVAVAATGDIQLKAAAIAAHDISLDGRNVEITDQHVARSDFSAQTQTAQLGYTHTETTSSSATSVGSTLAAREDGGKLVIHAKKNVSIQGSDLSGDKGQIRSDTGNVLTKMGQDLAYEKQAELSESFVANANSGIGGAEGQASYDSVKGAETTAFVDGKEVRKPAAEGKLNNGKAVLGELAGGFFGYARHESEDTHETVKNRNTQLNFGSNLEVEATQGQVDIGGADLRAKGDLSIRGADVLSTKFEDFEKATSKSTDMTLGVKAEGHSAIADTINHAKQHVDDATAGKAANAGATVAQVAGDITNLLFNDTVGSSQSLSYKVEQRSQSSTTTSEKLNTLSGKNVKIQSTKGDVQLAGVTIDATDTVELDAAGKLALTAAKSFTESRTGYLMNQVTVGVNEGANAVFQSANVGGSLGYNGAMDKTESSTLKHTNSQIKGAHVSVKSGQDTVVQGANVEGGNVDLDVNGDLKVASVQDESTMTHERGDWGVQVGMTVGASGQTGPAAARGGVSLSAQGGYGKDWDNSKLTKTQSGIHATEKLDAQVTGNIELKGAAIGADSGEGALHVGGKTTAEALQDWHNKDGGYAGGGFGVTVGATEKVGTSGVNVNVETVDQVFYQATNKATIGLKDFGSRGGVVGSVNRDLASTKEVTDDRKIAGVQIAVTMDPDAMKGKQKADVEGGGAPGKRYRSLAEAESSGSSKPFFNAPERLEDGRVGYLLSPVKPVGGKDIGSKGVASTPGSENLTEAAARHDPHRPVDQQAEGEPLAQEAVERLQLPIKRPSDVMQSNDGPMPPAKRVKSEAPTAEDSPSVEEAAPFTGGANTGLLAPQETIPDSYRSVTPRLRPLQSKEAPQLDLPNKYIKTLTISPDGDYEVEREKAPGRKVRDIADGRYVYGIRAEEPECVYCFDAAAVYKDPELKRRADAAALRNYGHSSLGYMQDGNQNRFNKAEGDTWDSHFARLAKPMLLAGYLNFDDGRLTSWSVYSGHYKPSIRDAFANRTGRVKKLLPWEKFDSILFDGQRKKESIPLGWKDEARTQGK